MDHIRGVIYTAYGEKFVKQAIESANSVRRHSPTLGIGLYTDKKDPNLDYSMFDFITIIDIIPTDFHQYMLNRLLSLPKSPFAHTLALDTDTIIMSDITDMFELMGRFDIAMTHGHNRQKRYMKALASGKADPSIPYAFAPVQGGLMLYNKSEPIVSKFLEDLIALYKEKNYYDDQVAMRELLWKIPLKLYMLPREYNFCNSKYIDSMVNEEGITTMGEQSIPKIFHYLLYKQNPLFNASKYYE